MNNIRNQVGRLIKSASYLGMAITFVLVWITTIDVILRKVSNFSILGSYELTEIGLVILISLVLPALQVDRGMSGRYVCKQIPRSRKVYCGKPVVLLV